MKQKIWQQSEEKEKKLEESIEKNYCDLILVGIQEAKEENHQIENERGELLLIDSAITQWLKKEKNKEELREKWKERKVFIKKTKEQINQNQHEIEELKRQQQNQEQRLINYQKLEEQIKKGDKDYTEEINNLELHPGWEWKREELYELNKKNRNSRQNTHIPHNLVDHSNKNNWTLLLIIFGGIIALVLGALLFNERRKR